MGSAAIAQEKCLRVIYDRLWPRIDVGVAKDLLHTLKVPFSAQPATRGSDIMWSMSVRSVCRTSCRHSSFPKLRDRAFLRFAFICAFALFHFLSIDDKKGNFVVVSSFSFACAFTFVFAFSRLYKSASTYACHSTRGAWGGEATMQGRGGVKPSP